MPRADELAFGRLDADGAAVLDHDARRLGHQRGISPPLSRTAASSARASAAVPPRDICALAGLASSAAM